MIKKNLLQLMVLAVSALLLAATSFAQQVPQQMTSSAQVVDLTYDAVFDGIPGMGTSCAVATPVPPMQGTQQIHVCNNWTAAPGANIELFNTTGQSCTISQGDTAWPFVQSAPLTVANGSGVWVTLLTTLTNGGTYDYSPSCCPNLPTNPKIIVQ